MSKLKWRTNEGQELDIEKMTTGYIINCIRAIQADRIQERKYIDIGYTGDGDGNGIEYQWIDYGENYIKAFKRELKNRGIIYE